jgi:hypothetical protein
VLRTRIAGDNVPDIRLSSQWQGVSDVIRHWWLVLRCAFLGTALGAIPGIGSAVIDWIAYGYAQRTERNPESFGTGDVRGVIAPESSNNAKEGGHLVPTIAFGVPAGASMAILLGAFLMHGLTPGPEMLTKHLDVTYAIVWSLTLAHVMGAVICLSCSRWLAQVSRIRPEILLPIIVALVFVAAYEGSHDWGDLFSLFTFGVLGWFMKRLGWPRPPLVLGLVIGAIFERYLYLSTELYGWAWLLHMTDIKVFGYDVHVPVVLLILACVAWALYRPISQIVVSLVQEFRQVRRHSVNLDGHVAFTLVIIALIVAAIVSARDWPQAAKIVPLTACGMALVAAAMNLINELFGKRVAVAARGHVDGGVHVAGAGGGALSEMPGSLVRVRAAHFFFWLALLVAIIAGIGFIPAIAVFIVAYMRIGFGEPWRNAVAFALLTTLLCWLVFDWALAVVWPRSLLGDLFPDLRSAIGLI